MNGADAGAPSATRVPVGQCDKPLCAYYRVQFDRALVEMLKLRLEVADGPRARVRELEATVERQNATIADRNARIRSLEKKVSA